MFHTDNYSKVLKFDSFIKVINYFVFRFKKEEFDYSFIYI